MGYFETVKSVLHDWQSFYYRNETISHDRQEELSCNYSVDGSDMLSENIKCEHCGGIVKPDAVKCKHCHKTLIHNISDRKPLRVPDKTLPEHDIEKDKGRHGFVETLASIIITLAILGFISATNLTIVESSWLIFILSLSSLITLVAIYSILVLLNGIALNISAVRQLLSNQKE